MAIYGCHLSMLRGLCAIGAEGVTNCNITQVLHLAGKKVALYIFPISKVVIGFYRNTAFS